MKVAASRYGHPERSLVDGSIATGDPSTQGGALGMTVEGNSVNLDSVIAQTRAIVFDWNGTLVDDADRALLATNHVLAYYGREQLDSAAFSTSFKLPMFTFFRELGLEEINLVTALQLWNCRLAAERTRLQPRVVDLLQTAHRLDIIVGVVSAAAEEAVRADAVALGIDRYLAFIAGSASDKVATLTEIVSWTRGTVLYVGDTEYDMFAGHEAGAIAIGYGRGYRPSSALAETNALAVIDDYVVICAALNRCFARR